LSHKPKRSPHSLNVTVVTHFQVPTKINKINNNINKINSQKDQKKIIAGRSAQKMVGKIGQGSLKYKDQIFGSIFLYDETPLEKKI
jgi:hypothetical protein